MYNYLEFKLSVYKIVFYESFSIGAEKSFLIKKYMFLLSILSLIN